ncbi:MAG: flagellar hook-length control protein FliK [Corticimicrobacter sp.]|uniref:flagellar hook-length control protein FliK n=1 Tax=Corticimicrobacter sp. TaxID=2678536 RepID=UPI0032DBAFA4
MSVTSSVLHVPVQADTDAALRGNLAPAGQAGQELDTGTAPFKDLLTQRKRAIDDTADTDHTDQIVSDHTALGLLQAFIQQDVTQGADPASESEEEAIDADALLRIGDRAEGNTKDTPSQVKATPRDMLELAAQRDHIERAAPKAGSAMLQDQDAAVETASAAAPAVRDTGITALTPAAARPDLATTSARTPATSSQAQQRNERAQLQAGAFQAIEPVQAGIQQLTQNSASARTADPLAAIDTQLQQHNTPTTGSVQPTGLPHVAVATGTHDQIQATVGSRAWAPELGQHVARLGNQAIRLGVQHAELRLDPPDLGPLRITLSLQDGIAQASFVSPHIAVRQAVESALPQLQQALNQAGIALGEANVGDHTAQQRQDEQFAAKQGQAHGGSDSLAGSDATSSGLVSAAAQSRRPDALIDVFV